MSAYLRKYDNEFIPALCEKKGLKDNDLVQLTKEHDPSGKGLAHMTCRRARLGEKLSIDSLLMLCYSLGIRPESTFKKAE